VPCSTWDQSQGGKSISRTGLSPSVVILSRSLPLSISFVTPRLLPWIVPQPPLFRKRRFRLLPFRSPLLRESRLISFPRGTEMFHFPPFASPPCGRDDRALPRSGFPIRAPSSHSLLSGSLRLFAASHALHRISAPRHPPHALSSLPTPLSCRATTCIYPSLINSLFTMSKNNALSLDSASPRRSSPSERKDTNAEKRSSTFKAKQ
jgi:hypothetical protein